MTPLEQFPHEATSNEAALVPLDEAQRAEYPHVVYQEASDTADSHIHLVAVLEAAHAWGLPVIGDLAVDEENGLLTAVVRTSADRQPDQRSHGALIHGAVRAIGLFESTQTDEAVAPRDMADAFVGQIAGNEKMYEAFRDYYGGLRWITDQERFRSSLFTNSAKFDPVAVKEVLNGYLLTNLVYALDLEIPYNETRGWRETTPERVLEDHPELDYRRLSDEDFKATEEGRRLKQAYSQMLGNLEAERYNSMRWDLTEDGRQRQRAPIPLSKFPVVEALMVDEVSLSKPHAKYDFGPNDVTGFIVASDSLAAQNALVRTINTRLAPEDRYVFDGPDEFEHKRRVISEFIYAYEKVEDDLPRREVLKSHLQTILAAHTGNGVIAESVKAEAGGEENQTWRRSSFGDLNTIASDILTSGLASPDAEDFFKDIVSDSSLALTGETDPLALSTSRLQTIVLDALNKVDHRSQPDVIQRVAVEAFGDEAISQRIRHIVELRMEGIEFLRSPEVLRARKEYGSKSTLGFDKPEAVAARENLDIITAPGDDLMRQATAELNQLVFDYAWSLLDQRPNNTAPNNISIKELLNYLTVSAYKAVDLPEGYHQLIMLSEHANITIDEKATIAWKIQGVFEHAYGDAAKLIPGAILDVYRMMLGPVDSLSIPGKRVGHGLAAAGAMAGRSGIFIHANEEDLLTLSRYKGELGALLGRILSGALAPTVEVIGEGDETFEEWQQRTVSTIGYIVRTMSNVEDSYKEFLHIEEVKVKPNVYYPWLMQKMAPFWQMMQWEVGPGNMPSREIRALHGVLQDHIQSKLVLKDDEYEEDFDYFGAGHLDSLLLECYHRMVVPHDIKYNGTVWREGLSFMHYAIAYMPPVILERFKQDRPHEQAFIDYLEREHARWNKKD